MSGIAPGALSGLSGTGIMTMPAAVQISLVCARNCGGAKACDSAGANRLNTKATRAIHARKTWLVDERGMRTL